MSFTIFLSKFKFIYINLNLCFESNYEKILRWHPILNIFHGNLGGSLNQLSLKY